MFGFLAKQQMVAESIFPGMYRSEGELTKSFRGIIRFVLDILNKTCQFHLGGKPSLREASQGDLTCCGRAGKVIRSERTL
jgi:hypothetical protein